MVKKGKQPLRPLVSICTPTFNRRPFFPFIIKGFNPKLLKYVEKLFIPKSIHKYNYKLVHIKY